MEYDHDETQSSRDIRRGRAVTLILIALFVITGVLLGRN